MRKITDTLNAEFTGEVRKLVFWYDAKAEFTEDVDELGLENAQVLHLAPDNQFYIKYYLECVDTITNYLVYAPFPQPAMKDNHLADTVHYSKVFFADRASLLTLDLGIDERFKPVVQHYIAFFSDRKRTQAFYELELEAFNRDTIEIALMSVICKTKTASFDEVMRCVLTEDGFEENAYLAEFEKYELISAFWEHIESTFGYVDAQPTLQKFVMTAFATYAAKTIHGEVPQAWKPFVAFKSGNIVAFLDNMMNSYLYSDKFDEVSMQIFESLGGAPNLTKLPLDSIVDCNVFSGVDTLLIDWMNERLITEDIDAKLAGKTVPEICVARRKLHFGRQFRSEYFILENAWNIIARGVYSPVSGITNVVKQYIEKDYLVDRRYRYFYYYYDKLEDNAAFESLRELVENIYTNDYLNRLAVNWTADFLAAGEITTLPHQYEFYNKYVNTIKERAVVIISDAMRYEVGQTLFERFQSDEKCTATITAMYSALPSYTPLGMAALLPHKTLGFNEAFDVLIDGKPCDDLKQREAILKTYKPNSRCVRFDDIKAMKVAELRGVFTGQDVVYVYHNQIDARGDNASTENEVFDACEEAVEEIFALIKRLTSSANTIHFIVTADHGFIYKRDRLAESDKISGVANAGRRYAFSDAPLSSEGVGSMPISRLLNNTERQFVSFPLGTDLFKAPGAGQNFVHGGCSPLEMLVPMIDVRTEKGHKDTHVAQIVLVSLTTKITNLITTLDFLQTEAVSDIVKETRYRLYFIADNNEKVTNEIFFDADNKAKESIKRMFRIKFSFKNIKYEKTRRYYLVAYDDKNNLEVLRHEMIIDIAFADDFGFNL